jgi:hypothetical protein
MRSCLIQLRVLSLTVRQLSQPATLRLGPLCFALLLVAGIFRPVLLQVAGELRVVMARGGWEERALCGLWLIGGWALLWAAPMRGLLRLALWRPWRRAPLSAAMQGALVAPWLLLCASPVASAAALLPSPALPRAALWATSAPLVLAGLTTLGRRPGAAWVALLWGGGAVAAGELGAAWMWGLSAACGAALLPLGGLAHRQLTPSDGASWRLGRPRWPRWPALALARRDAVLLWRGERSAAWMALGAQVMLGGLMVGIAWNNPGQALSGPLSAAMLVASALGALAFASALARLMGRLGLGFGAGRLPVSSAQRALASWVVGMGMCAPAIALGGAAGGAALWGTGLVHAACVCAAVVRLVWAAGPRQAATARAATPAAVLLVSIAAWRADGAAWWVMMGALAAGLLWDAARIKDMARGGRG